MNTAIDWPRKTRELHNHHFDSTIWNEFDFRDDDVIVSTYGKSGTTWTQQIVSQILFNGDEAPAVAELSPWLDLRVPPKEMKLEAMKAQTHRRFIKTHLPVDALVYEPRAKYIYVGRDGRDVVWSFYNHHITANDMWYAMVNDTPGLVGPPIGKPNPDVRQYFLEWLEKDGHPMWPYWENVRSWWDIRALPNILFVHFADLKANMNGEMRRIAKFLDVSIDEQRWPTVVEHCTFDYMKANADKSAPLGGGLWEGGGGSFINKGNNGRWKDVLTAEDCARYEDTAQRELGDACAAWLAKGGRV